MVTGAPSRIVVTRVAPQVGGGRHPVKRVEAEPVDVEATVLVDGHDELWVVLSHQPPDATGWLDVPMRALNPGLDLWTGRFTPAERGLHRFKVLAWIDHFASLVHGTLRKLADGQDVTSELLQGAVLLEAAAEGAPSNEATALLAAAGRMRAAETGDLTDPGAPARPSAVDLHRRQLRRADAASSVVVEVLVERERAAFSAWYELFPRSTVHGDGTAPDAHGAAVAHGTLRDVIERLDYVGDLGFDVLYLPPIHPIGTSFRKGPDNATEAGPDDPGSPWAIGSAEGGHDAVHPDLGNLDDVRALAAAAAENGIELALDLAFQCSPDHPWVTEHPEWFRHRPDGSIQYAENPPKKYQDIYPLDFESKGWSELWQALLDVVELWIDSGVSIFRVDNPHTKPFAFWEWLIDRVHRHHPEVIFLAEAFTRPEVMHQLARIGFTQSYTYFTWRVSKPDLVEYATEVSTSPSADAFRPNFWPTTPDILPWHLQEAPLEAFAVRHLLAATLSASYGIYGPAFELGENQPMGNGKEEYAASEKYEVRHWDLTAPSLRDQITRLNRIRNEQLALHTTRTLRFHDVANDQLLAYSKTTHDGPDPDPRQPHRNPVLCVVNLDPRSGQAAVLDLDLVALGIDPSRPYQVHDLLSDQHFTWQSHHPYVELHPDDQPGHVFRVSQLPAQLVTADGPA
jgi:starch synthase (maltosyl-transferring)